MNSEKGETQRRAQPWGAAVPSFGRKCSKETNSPLSRSPSAVQIWSNACANPIG